MSSVILPDASRQFGIPTPSAEQQGSAVTFYTGVGHPNWLNTATIPLFLSVTTLARYRSRGDAWPIRGTSGAPWAGDSGAYAALMLATDGDGHPWSLDGELYGGLWLRLVEEIGRRPDFIAPQDWPCEPAVRLRTGLTVRDHQELTLDSYCQLAEGFPWLPWMPVLQGWTVGDYLRHAAMYAAADVDLAACGRVGVGSICRRGSQRAVAAVLEALSPLGLRLHGFGMSINALRLGWHHLASADSQAWSAVARREHIRLPGCAHTTKAGEPSDCRNCPRWAQAYRERALAAVADGARWREEQPELDLWGEAA